MPHMVTNDTLAEGLFFIVGVGRSGTTLLQAMLSSHPRIGIPPETSFFQRFDPVHPPLRRDPVPVDCLDDYLRRLFSSLEWETLGLEREAVEQAIRQSDRSARSILLAVLSEYQRRTGRPRIGEKTPLHARCIPRIRHVFPEARFIHIFRDPRDVVASRLRMSWSDGSTRDEARLWVKILTAHLECMRTVPPSVYTQVRFETLVAEPESELRRLCTFLGEAYHPSMLSFYQRSERGYDNREHAWKGMTQHPLSPDSIGRFKRDLTMRQVAQIERVVGRLLGHFGYASCSGWRKYHPGWVVLDGIAHVGRKLAREVSTASSSRRAFRAGAMRTWC